MNQVPFRHGRRVTYADCTVGKHVYYARHLDFLEAARGDFSVSWESRFRPGRTRG
jgi:acyl-CoA thioesterase FadM